jgi:hypothetical protein
METLLEKVIGLDYRLVGNGDRWRKTEEHDSLVLDLQNQVWFWNSRNLCGSPIDYLIKVKGYTKDVASDIIRKVENIRGNYLRLPAKNEIVVPNEKLVDLFWERGKIDRDYWYRRCLNDSSIDRFRLGKFDGFWMLPIYVDGQFRNFQCRTDIPEKKIRQWYRGVGPLLFNSSILEITSRVFITEGPVDAILLNQLGYPAMSHVGGAGGWQEEWFKYFLNQKEIFYISDNDSAGFKGAKKVSKSLGEGRVKIILYLGEKEKYDTVDFFRDGHSTEEFDKLVEDSKFTFELKDIYANKEDTISTVSDSNLHRSMY